jgi:hypothetical protein
MWFLEVLVRLEYIDALNLLYVSRLFHRVVSNIMNDISYWRRLAPPVIDNDELIAKYSTVFNDPRDYEALWMVIRKPYYLHGILRGRVVYLLDKERRERLWEYRVETKNYQGAAGLMGLNEGPRACQADYRAIQVR